jgi:hypothetical protein
MSDEGGSWKGVEVGRVLKRIQNEETVDGQAVCWISDVEN